MKKISITEAKNGLSAFIDGLKGGSRFLIVDRGRPVARLEPVTNAGKDEQDGRVSRLVREGVIRPARAAALPRSLFSGQPPRPKGDASVVAALLEERRESR
jgi:antitoxin (DNA-binding transcriptional repressor) of toxin-antitoxin stability system